jgi:pyruvate/2-oxoglutarate dehydrogenase complex dihydrolipoamide acyltransferase (E2) component
MSEEQGQSTKRPATERADELLDRVGWTAGLFGSMIAMRLTRVAAYAREEAEDLWAEAQSIRRQNGEDLGQTATKVADTAREKAGQAAEGVKQGFAPSGEAETGAATSGASAAGAPSGVEETGRDAGRDGGAEVINATETARRRAEELGVDLSKVEGTGTHGKIIASDVEKAAQAES